MPKFRARHVSETALAASGTRYGMLSQSVSRGMGAPDSTGVTRNPLFRLTVLSQTRSMKRCV